MGDRQGKKENITKTFLRSGAAPLSTKHLQDPRLSGPLQLPLCRHPTKRKYFKNFFEVGRDGSGLRPAPAAKFIKVPP